MHTHGVKYIGSKNKLISHIIQATNHIPPSTMIDVFTGTTRVAQAYRKSGWKVYTSDLNWASEAYAHLFLMNDVHQIKALEPYVDRLNKLSGEADWITNNYCDAKAVKGTNLIKVWKPKNGIRADAIRNQIQQWEESEEISHHTAMSLIAVLILALDAVDSTVGQQQAYLKDWSSRSDHDLVLKIPDDIHEGIRGEHQVGNSLELDYPKATLAYLDPPYSAHSYATYYHIWDSITRWDKPEVALETNRRVDRTKEQMDNHMRSEWNSKSTVYNAFEELLDRLPVNYILLSYSNESLLTLEQLRTILDKYKYTIQEIDYKRNIMSQIGNASLYQREIVTKNIEYLILIEKGGDEPSA